MRTPLVAGNWKMNGDRAMAESLCSAIVQGASRLDGVEIAICPPYTLLNVVYDEIADGNCALGAQDMDINDNGAFTGQVSASMLKNCGCSHVILGHSERRTIYGETDALVARKVEKALASGLTAILCVGETQEERESGITESVVTRQIAAVIDLVTV